MTPLPTPAAATVFLELWKRHRARVVLHWDLYGWDEDQVRGDQGGELPLPSALWGPNAACQAWGDARVPRLSRVCWPPQEELALELINCRDYKLQTHQHSYWRSTVILVLSLFMVLLGSPGRAVRWAGGCPPSPPSWPPARRSAS